MESPIFEEGGMCELHDIAATCLWVLVLQEDNVRDYCIMHSMH